MSNASAAEAVFFAALEKKTAAERAAYLDGACAGDADLRRQVEKLLTAHPKVGDFLQQPAANHMAAASDATQELDFSATPENDPPAAEQTEGDGSGDDEDDGLDFLQPSARPDSLGRLGHYEALQILGKGGFGVVFRAFDEVLQRVVAVKVLAARIAATSPARKRFLREARSSAKVRHENVVQVYAVEELPLPYLVMEFIPGETLQQRITRTGPLETAEVARIGRQIAEGLAAAHDTGLIHRDIKPANILIEAGPHERVKITDFGLARAADDASMTQSGMIAGTPMFMAPEQAQGDKLDHRADLFSLGSVLYMMCSGRAPFRATGTLAVLKRVVEDTPRPIPEIIPEVPAWLCDLITKLHAKKPADRIATAREVADLLAAGPAAPRPAVMPAPEETAVLSAVRPRGRARRWAVAAAVLLPLMALAAAGVAWVTHAIRSRATPADSIMANSEPTPIPAVKSEPPVVPAPIPAVKSEPPVVPAPPTPTFKNGIGMEFVVVPKGKAWLGGGKDTPGDKEVVIPADFYLGTYEVTQEEWTQVMGDNPSDFSRTGEGKDAVKDIPDAGLKRFPVEQVSWDDCQLFIERLNKREKKSGWVYRLPTEVEWEYACRGGPMADKRDSGFDYYFAEPTNTLSPELANFDNGLKRTCPVGSYAPNRLGLFDMHGNIGEYCDDAEKVDDGAVHRIVRGASWIANSNACKATWRFVCPPSKRIGFDGFRLARVPVKALPTFKNGLGMEFALVPKGKSWLGGSNGKLGDNEVEIPADFYLGKYEVTQEEWTQVMGENPSHFSRTGGGNDAVKDIPDADLKRFPVDTVSWEACQIFVARLNKLEKDTGWVYRLPKEAEWEYACRGGPMADKADSAFDFYFAKPTNAAGTRANLNTGTVENPVTLGRTCKVGSYEPNALGLHDMHGNLHVWCDDAAKTFDEADGYAMRGGAWNSPAEFCSAASRLMRVPSSQSQSHGLRLARVPTAAPPPEAKTPPLAVAPFSDADVPRIAALPAAAQVEAVRKELVRLNPKFDGKLEHKIEGDAVTELHVLTDEVVNIAPVRALTRLIYLDCRGTYPNKGKLSDLSPLKGMKVSRLDCSSTQIADLTPLAGLPLTFLHFNHNPVSALAPLKGMPLAELGCAETKVSDFSPLKGMKLQMLGAQLLAVTDLTPLQGMPLKGLDLYHTIGATNLEPLRGMPLEGLNLQDVPVSDLSALKGMTSLRTLVLAGDALSDLTPLQGLKLTDLFIRDKKVSDLSPLKGMPLARLGIDGTAVTDLRPLQGMALAEISLTPKNISQGLDILRAMKSLKTIGISREKAWPAAEFWARLDKGEFK